MSDRRRLLKRLTSLWRGDGGRPREPVSDASLDLEWRTFVAHRAGLLASHEGQWVVIHRDQILGVRPEYEEALRLGYEKAGYVDLMVHRIQAEEPILILPPQPV